MKKPALVLFLAALVLGVGTVDAQPRTVTINYDGSDLVGARLEYHLKEGLRRSASLQFVEKGPAWLTIYLISISAREKSNDASAYSAAWTYGANDRFLDQWIGICGSDKVASCADSLLINTDKVRGLLVNSKK
jgi:hypothetical protein